MSTFRLSRLSACLLLAASPSLYAETSQSNPPRSLETIDVTAAPSGGDYDAGMTTEGKDSYTTDATNTATRMVLSPRETPQSVTVITREQMEDFGLNSVAEVMQRTPGVTVNAQDTERLQFFARGFEITNFLYDGMPSMRNSSLGKQAAQADTFIYDRVEVLRGASGLLHGIGNPSATINLVRKKPTRDFSGQVGVEANSWNGYRGELDVGGPIDGNDKVRARFVSAYEQGESFLDHYENEKQVFYGVIEGDISDSTMITLGMDYMDYDPQGSTWGGIPLFYSDGGIADLDRDTNPATDWSSWAQDARTAFMHLEHQFDSGWYGKLAYTYQENNYDAQLASAGGGTLNRDGSGKTLWSGRFQEEKHQDTFDLYANGPFELFGRQHELVVGASHSRAKRDYTGQPALNFDNTLDNLFTWDGNRAKPAWGANNAEEKELIEQTGFYATARFKPTDSLAVITGGRVVDWERSRSGFNWAGPFPDHERHFEENGEVVPFAGVVYDLNQHHSVYASYTSIFQPQTARDIDNRVLDPEEGNSYEAGLKSEFRDGRVNTTVAVFRTDQDNLAESTGQPIPGGPANSEAYRAVDGAQTNGFELEASGEILPRWQLLAGYTYRITEDPEGDELNTTSPEDMLRLSTRYRFNGSLDGLTLGTSIAWQNKTYAFVTRPGHSGDFKFVQDAYTLVDLMARYQFNPALSVTANVSNLTDEKYFNNLGFYNGGYYGDGRKASLKLNYRF
ncbi:MAG: TonB-dependent siderophore receptor [Alcanivorax sp.]|nr:TonB-dependent siderophore receptor [Alcanivorax sp.]